ncbi:MAG TPA: hypothetical protein VFT70_06575 [Nocardioides sp.]|nr:hypothetical protein [Nocardioides sp.]
MFEQPTHIYLNPVAREKTEEFERFIRDVVVPALEAQRPDLVDRWHVLKPAGPEAVDSGVCTYAFVFDGGTVEDDWELGTLLPAHYGEAEADRLLSGWMDTFVPLSRWRWALEQADAEAPQVGWTFISVR